ncbi:C-X-C chemokine receptor type 2-like [Protopterus annectens]|uniref:C-X-C chemokine receptor type 2-like n=1 Tax=Protopterus annectens TaxID=7888 RepID=UPI001CFB7286|nr:C-X-C chemokine receptor type 2-like [Protopterus annectens]
MAVNNIFTENNDYLMSFLYESWMNNTQNSTFTLDPDTIPCNYTVNNEAAGILLCVVYILIFFLAILGNIIVIVVISHNRQSMSSTDTYLLHLSIADMLFATTLPFWVTNTLKEWVFGDFLCKAISMVQEVNFYSSILFLACISVDRYRAIVKAHKHRHPIFTRLSCVVIWGFGIFFSLPVLFRSAFKAVYNGKLVCYEDYNDKTHLQWRMITWLLRHIIGFLLPLSVMLFCYGATIRRIFQSKNFEKKKAMKVIIAVVLVFLVCWLPYNVVISIDTLLRCRVMEETCQLRNRILTALSVTHSLALLHSCINPILYAFIGVKFRYNVLKILMKQGILNKSFVRKYARSFSVSSDSTMSSTTL